MENLKIRVTPDAAAGTCTFDGPAEYVTTSGHIILFKVASKSVHIRLHIEAAGYRFDRANPFVPVTAYRRKGDPAYYSKRFSKPVLSSGDRQLDVDNANTGRQHIYYTLNFLDPKGNPFSFDPIIVNN